MSFLKQIDDKGAVLEWCPLPSFPNLVALGTKDSSGGGFDDEGGSLELHQLDLADTSSGSTTLLGKVQANARFSSIAWSRMAHNPEEFPYGIIAGGMIDGHIKVWDAAKLIQSTSEDGSDALLASILQHQGAIGGLQFNTHADMSYLLASGGADGEVFIISLERPDAPHVFSPAPPPNTIHHTADVTKLAWNTQVSHILASCAQNGSCIVWDLKGKKAWCELKEPLGGSFTDLCWNPDQGLNLVTASGDDKNPVLKLWDLRSSTSLPLATLSAHTQGVLSVSWCPTDSSLLLSCGKDNKTFLWDLYQMQPIYELPTASNEGDDGRMGGDFGGGLAGQRRYHIAWAACLPAVVSACSFDRKVQFYSISGYKSKTGRAPKWLRRPVGASFGFGGKLVSFSNATLEQPSNPRNRQKQGVRASVFQVVEDVPLVQACDQFHESLAQGDFKRYCEYKAASAESEHDREVWGLMKVVCFEQEARQELLRYLGYDNATIAEIGQQFLSEQSGNPALPSPAPLGEASEAPVAVTVPPPAPEFSPPPFMTAPVDAAASQDFFSAGGANAEDVFGAPPSAADGDTQAETEATAAETTSGESTSDTAPPAPEETAPTPPPASEPIAPPEPPAPPIDEPEPPASEHSAEVQALSTEMASQLVLSKRVEPIIRNALIAGNFSLAVDCCMQSGLYAEALLLAQCAGQDLWMNTQQAYFNLMLKKMDRPVLRILQAVTKSELGVFVEASVLTSWKETLAVLSTYARTEEFPHLCILLAERLENECGDVQAATLCYMCANKVSNVVGAWAKELIAANASLGHLCTKSLQQFIEKVVVFTKATTAEDFGEECVAFFAEYASLLASQGRLDVAAKYLYGDNAVESILRDRVYQSTPNKPAGSKAPPFPFNRVPVGTGGGQAKQGSGGGRAAAGATVGNKGANMNRAGSNSSLTGGQQFQPRDTVQTAEPAAQAQPVQQSAEPSLPPGWLQLVDPSSGRPYFVNQSTGVSQWESPPLVYPEPVPAPAPTPVPAATTAQPSHTLGGTGFGGTPNNQQPKMSTFTPNARPTPAVTTQQPSSGSGPSPAVSAVSPAAASQPAEAVDTSVQTPIVQEMNSYIASLSEVCSPSEKRQISMATQSLQVLNAKILTNEVTPDVMGKVEQMVAALFARNYPQANAIQTELANTVWNQHKDWLKGFKVVIQLASKK